MTQGCPAHGLQVAASNMTPTVLLLDTDPAARARTAAMLDRGGLRVREHSDHAAALDDAAAAEPDAVVWALRTAEDTALGFARAYGRRFPGRATPLVVLSPPGDPASVAAALEGGADDCLPLSVAPGVLVAIVRARLRARASGLLRGDLGAIPFARLMQFCERSGLTGELEAEGARVEFVAGAVAPARRAAAERLLAVRAGRFVLRARPVDVRGLAGRAGEAGEAPARAPSPHHPAGRLSGVRIGDRVLQVQTEYATVPAPRVVTVVMLGGRTVHQRATSAPPGASREDLERLVTVQHADAERALHEKVAARAARRDPGTPRARFDRLHDEGLERFLAGDFAGAVEAWQEALGIDPSSQALAVNLAVARRKRDAAAPAVGAGRERSGANAGG